MGINGWSKTNNVSGKLDLDCKKIKIPRGKNNKFHYNKDYDKYITFGKSTINNVIET